MTTPDRPASGLPDFLLIGAPKAGTTTLAEMLDDLAPVHVAPAKEVSYFDLHHDRGIDWYRAQFQPGPGEHVLGEATPAYLYLDDALDRIAETVPDVRLVAILRDPVQRFWSHYWYFRVLGLEGRRIARVIDVESTDPAARIPGLPDLAVSYLGCGRYSEHIRAVHERFGADALHVVLLDDLVRAPGAVLAGVADHIGVGSADVEAAALRRSNPGVVPRSYGVARLSHTLRLDDRAPRLARRLRRWNLTAGSHPRIDEATRARLTALYATEYAELPDLLGRDLPASWGSAS